MIINFDLKLRHWELTDKIILNLNVSHFSLIKNTFLIKGCMVSYNAMSLICKTSWGALEKKISSL